MLKRIPEIVLGALLAVAIFGMGMLFSSGRHPTETRAAQNAANRESSQPHERGFWDWVTHDAAGFFTLWLVIVGGGQIGLFYWQLRYMRRGVEDAGAAARAAQQSAETARLAFTTLERPYVFVFEVSPLKREVISDADDICTWISVTYSVGNYGKIPAIIKNVQAGLSVSDDPESPARVSDWHPLKVSPILKAGEVRTDIDAGIVWEPTTSTEDDPQAPDFGDRTLFFWVIITYRGPFTDQHETRACWRYDGSRFIGPHGGPEYSGEK